MKTLADKLGLTQAEYQEFLDTAQRTWDIIGLDIINANGGKTLRRSEVIEVVLDASHMIVHNPDMSSKVKDMLNRYDTVTVRLRRRAMLEAFPYAYYGL